MNRDSVSVALSDQIAAARADASRALSGANLRGGGFHPVQGPLAQDLADALVIGSAHLCPHARAPQRVWWSPGFTVVGCEVCWFAAEVNAPTHRECASCGDPTIPADSNRMLRTAGPAIIATHLCDICTEYSLEEPTSQDLLLLVEASCDVQVAFELVWGRA